MMPPLLPDVLPGTPGAAVHIVATAPGAVTVETTWPPGHRNPVGHETILMTIDLPRATAVSGLRSSWGMEFEPMEYPMDDRVVLEVDTGRSSNGAVPVMCVTHPLGATAVTIHWSGNWRLTATSGQAGTTVVAALPPQGQQPWTSSDEPLRLPRVSIAVGDTPQQASIRLVRLLSGQIPDGPALLTEWNHWWPYEDVEIDEGTFLANAAVAADLGIDVAVLDAGWFGADGRDTAWYEQRGDWASVNRARFPRGLAALADDTRSLGIEFGIWIEAEAVGRGARIAQEDPDLLAHDRAGNALGYVCLGSPAGRAHIIETVSALVSETTARWIKWDFNLDPGTGCARTDHGHHAADGLWQHYRGLYDVLDRLRTKHPDVMWEACSSGGLRIDAGLAAHVDAFFLSDPDWTEHHLCCLWGACQLLPPRQLLHWPESEWRGEHRFQKVDYSGTLLTQRRFDTKIRAAMLHRFGISVRLTQMRPDLKQRLRQHLDIYTSLIRPMLGDGILTPLTAQPLREEQGCRQPAFQLDGTGRHLVAGFRLPPLEPWRPVTPRGLESDQRYRVGLLDAPMPAAKVRTGEDLTRNGLSAPENADSAMWMLELDEADDAP